MQRVVAGSFGFVFSLLAVSVVACAPSGRAEDPDGSTPPPPPPIDSGTGPDAPGGGPPYQDFPAAPTIDGTAPANSGDLFGMPDGIGAGPCLAEPEIGTLFPKGWLRPRFTVVPSGSQNLYEIRLHADDEANDLVVYTSNRQWTMPGDTWAKMSLHLGGKPITVTIRGAQLNGTVLVGSPSLGTTGKIEIAPASATGSIVYWTTSAGSNPNASALKAFDIGNEAVRVVLRPQNAGLNAATSCFGCHTTTPDGKYLAFANAVDPNISGGALIDGRPGFVDLRVPLATVTDAPADRPPSDVLSDTAIGLLARKNQHAPAFTLKHWVPGDRIALTMFQPNAGPNYSGPTNIIWTDLETNSTAEGTGWGTIARTGDTKSASAAVFSHDGMRIAYVSGNSVDSGVRNNNGDVYTVPYNNRLGGAATPVAGASDVNKNESYPSFSADDTLLTFTQSNFSGDRHSYDNPTAEVFIVDANGGTPTRLKANDPNTCGGAGGVSPGVTNSWPKWSPGPVENVGGKRYYWITFSSRRGASHLPQIYVAPVVFGEAGIETYPAIYLWNQPANEANHTPAWDNLQIN